MQRLEAKGLLVRMPGEGPVQFTQPSSRSDCCRRSWNDSSSERSVDRPRHWWPIWADQEKLSARTWPRYAAIARKLTDEKQDS